MLPLIVQVERTEERVADTCAFAQSPVRIGRNPLNDLQLDEGFVSQWHGVIRFDGQQTVYVDLGATNPALIDGRPVERNVENVISEGTDLRIGSLRLHLLRGEAPAELYGARRKTAFARTGRPDLGGVASTMYLGDVTPPVRSARQYSQEIATPEHQEVARSSLVPGHAGGGGFNTTASNLARPAQSVGSSSVRPVHSIQPGKPLPGEPQRSGSLSSRPISGANPIANHLDANLQGAYETYQRTWESFLARVRVQLEATVGDEREALFEQFVRAYPEIGRDLEFRALIAGMGISPLRTGVPEMEDWLRRLTDGLFPPPGVPVNVALAMERIGEVLEVFSTAFVELRRAHSQFCDEMSLDKPPDSSLLQTTENPRAVLAYLLNPGKEGSIKVNELSRAMADFALHQVALVSAVVQGARDMLQELSPTAMDEADAQTNKGGANKGFFGKLFGDNKDQLWQRYSAMFAEAVDEDRFTRKLFGRGFARKYYAITGGRRTVPPTK